MRLDQAIVQKKLISSRTKAKEAIEKGLVFYQGKPLLKPSTDIQDLDALEVRGIVCPYVSRGGFKLEKALGHFHLDLRNKTVLDIGSSTGGFTDCALQNGAKAVIAVDVGRDQMNPHLRQNPAVTLYEQTDFRDIDIKKIEKAQIVVSDVSFISITKMLPKICEMPNIEHLICLIKPQFECGKEVADKYHGVIKNSKIHETVLMNVLDTFNQCGFYLKDLTFSPILGGSGNIEYLAHWTRTAPAINPHISAVVCSAHKETNIP